MKDLQKTLGKSVKVNGIGLHTGHAVEINILPAPENHGYKFQRIDIEGKPFINALVDNVVDTSRGTTIEENGARVHTVEHILAALYGLEIDNALIEINGPELPILDGSSKIYVDSILEAGIAEQTEEKKYFVVKNNVVFNDEANDIEIIAIPDSKLNLSVIIDYKSNVLLAQNASLQGLENFKNEISSCRTFVFLHELEYLVKNNLIKGGGLENAIVIVDKVLPQEELDRLADLFNKPRVKLDGPGILNDKPLAFHNEPARHKLLDLVGDLALVGQPIKGRIIARKSGHLSNVEFAKKIRAIIKKDRFRNPAPEVDLNATPVMDIAKIKSLLPHRYPFLLVDKILFMDDTTIIGMKNITANEEFFNGHFPDEPVMPGVLQVEAMAQVGGLMVLSSVPDPQNYSTYFLKIDNVKFKRKVVPGDTLVFKLELISPIRRGVATMKGQAFVGDNLVVEGELMAQIAKK